MRTFRRVAALGALALFAIAAAACSSSSSDDSSAAPDDGGAGAVSDGAASPHDGGGVEADASGGRGDGGVKDSGPGAVVDSGDGFSAARKACIDEINRLRATEGHAALTLWTSPSIDSCVDNQATSDETNNMPHQAWSAHTDACDGSGQNECEGAGTSPAGIVSCLDSMWAEKDQPGCSGCAACSGAYNPSCPSCDFFGTNGPACGHYVNMSADYFTEVACGFSTKTGGSWSTQNYKP